MPDWIQTLKLSVKPCCIVNNRMPTAGEGAFWPVASQTLERFALCCEGKQTNGRFYESRYAILAQSCNLSYLEIHLLTVKCVWEVILEFVFISPVYIYANHLVIMATHMHISVGIFPD